jgi:hypothetical protein
MDPPAPSLGRVSCPAPHALGSIRESGKQVSVLGYLFSRLGFECGRFLRELHALRISWGTYQDGMCRRKFDEWHCNAHANNMVLLSEADGMASQSFLACLDLDMAFDDASFIDTWDPGVAAMLSSTPCSTCRTLIAIIGTLIAIIGTLIAIIGTPRRAADFCYGGCSTSSRCSPAVMYRVVCR